MLKASVALLAASVAITYCYFSLRRKSKRMPATLHICTACSLTNRDPSKANEDGTKLQTGKQMHESIIAVLSTKPAEWKQISTSTYEHVLSGEQLILNPMKCFSACSSANNVALSHPCKYQYHFGRLDPSTRDIEDVLQFCGQYVQNAGDAYTKAAERPERLQKANTVSRMPPPCPISK